MHFLDEESSYIPVSLGISECRLFDKIQFALNSAQFTTVPKHDS